MTRIEREIGALRKEAFAAWKSGGDGFPVDLSGVHKAASALGKRMDEDELRWLVTELQAEWVIHRLGGE